jgi:hemerythrin-like domain-containing protein
MKRIEQLQALSKEHHQSLVLAKKCKDIAVCENEQTISLFCKQLKDDFDNLWERHFRVEEQTIFRIAKTKSDELLKLSNRLENEHRIMNAMIEKISLGEYQNLLEFGQLLYDHTRTEERKLFPLIEIEFSDKELENILKFNFA